MLFLIKLFALQFKIFENDLDICPEGSMKVDYFNIGRIEAGHSLQVTAKGVFSKKVTSGQIHTQLLFGVIPIVNRHDDLCSAVGEVDLHCPLEGEKIIDKSFEIPKEVPKGHYVLRVDAIDQDRQKVTCISGTVTVN
eukprot:NODE_80_length_22759_cov_1.466858.p16 type:complete len:137 gc:universal NODE_80_length_22759_cov_1.466858:3211-3621(+)